MAELGLPDRYWDPEGIEAGGRRYFAVLGRPRGAAEAYSKLLALRDLASADRTPLGRARTLALDTVIRDLTRSMEKIGLLTAEAATEAAQRVLESSRKRPPQSGKRISLGDLIESHPIRKFPPLAEVGVGDIDTLSGHPGWRVQELGSTHLVEMTRRLGVYGAFQPGESPPDAGLSRVHPIFRTGQGARLIVRNEVAPRAYLRSGAVIAGVKRKQRLDRLDARLASEVRAIREGTHPRVRNARRVLATGRGRFTRL